MIGSSTDKAMNYDAANTGLTIRNGEHTVFRIIHCPGGERKEQFPQKIEVQAGGSLEIIIVSVPGSDRADKFSLASDILLTGEGAACKVSGAILCNGNSTSDIHLDIRHVSAGCSSTQSFRTIAAGNAKCSFHGKIIVSVGAQKTEAYQESHSILLSENAKVETLPQLEIYADDVKCSHGATIGKLDENEIFYMRSRGIPEKQAREILLQAFVSPVIELIPESTEKEYIKQHVNNFFTSI